jgi:hypothetical protein
MIVRRDENSWLIDGAVDLDAVLRALGDDSIWTDDDRRHYHTLGGLVMLAMDRVPNSVTRSSAAAFGSRWWTWTATVSIGCSSARSPTGCRPVLNDPQCTSTWPPVCRVAARSSTECGASTLSMLNGTSAAFRQSASARRTRSSLTELRNTRTSGPRCSSAAWIGPIQPTRAAMMPSTCTTPTPTIRFS